MASTTAPAPRRRPGADADHATNKTHFHASPGERQARRLGVIACVVACVFSVATLPLARVAKADDLGRTDPNAGLFPDSSIVDFSATLDAPAGKNGFVSVDENGHFVWEDGRRARFWGVNVSSKSVWVPHETIDRVVDVFAHAGINMVRFEALDSYGGLIDRPDSSTTQSLDPGKIRTLDYWTSKLRERGIYYYFDLLDFRQFKAGDDVPAYDQIGRAAKPYAIFDRRLIDLQKKYARQLLEHKNGYTGLQYVDDPALALVEVCNEHGLFFKADRLDSLVEPYGAAFRRLWNQWLLEQYSNREGVKAAWGRVGDTDVLQDNEDPATNSVSLPNFTPSDVQAAVAPDTNTPTAVDVRRAASRLHDGVRFLYEVQRAYFREMKAALRDMGVKVPITGVVSNEFVPDVASAAAECDFTSENYYYDHPAFAGKEWEGTFFYNDNDPLRYSSPYQLAPWLSALRWDNKPVVVREWATVWPNRFRSIAVPEMLAYASVQDFDAVLLFGYQTSQEPDRLSDFDHQADPTVWGLYAMGGQAFLRGDVRPAPWSVTLQYTPDTLFRWPNMLNNLHRLSWFVRVNSVLAEPRAASAAGGRGDRETGSQGDRETGSRVAPLQPAAADCSATGTRFTASKRASRPAVMDGRHGKRTQQAASPRHLLSVSLHPPSTSRLAYVGGPRYYRARDCRTRAGSMARSLSVPAGDPNSLAGVLEQLRVIGAPVDPRVLETGVLSATDGEVVRNTGTGLMKVATPRTIAVCGELPLNQPVTAGDWTLISPTGIGALMVTSLDGKPLNTSREYLVKMVTRAENTDQVLEPADPGAPARYHLKAWGKAPILTFGRQGGQLTLKRGAQTILTMWMEDGTWELLVRGGHATLVCDTPVIHGNLFGADFVTGSQAVVVEAKTVAQPAAYAKPKSARQSPPRRGRRAVL